MEPRVAGQLEASCVRISTADGAIVGAGFLVSEQGHVLTCAHVVADALGIEHDTTGKPQDKVHLDFPFLDAAACTASVKHWLPRTGPETNPSGDIAVLRLTEALPADARPAHLTVADELFGHEFRAYGYPKGHDAGIWAYGELRNRLGNGWLQVEDTKETGRRIEPGFSGGPVEDQKSGRIVGMVVASTRDKVDKVGFVIPTWVLARAWPDLTIVAEVPRGTSVNTADPMPPNFVPRPEELDELRRAIIGDRNTGPVALTGLRGMGGIGKTALAIALCHDDGLQEFFSDGVVWVDIGRKPGNLASKMKQVGQALGDGLGYYDTPEAGADRLRVLLKDKAVLLVLDDVWNARHVEPFIVDAPRCQVLFTTRNADIALRLDAREVPLGLLEPKQAVALLREWADRDDPALPDIAERLGYLPLALMLAGAKLHRDGVSGAEWLATFKRLSQLKFGRYSTDPQDNLQVCFDLSVDQLLPEDQQLYYALVHLQGRFWVMSCSTAYELAERSREVFRQCS